MDMLDPSLDSGDKDDSGEGDEVQLQVQTGDNMEEGEPGEEQAAAIASVAQGGTLTLDPNIQYQFRADTGQAGQVTYRVVQVAAPGGEGEQQAVVTTGNAFPQGQVAQAVIQSPFSNGSGSPTPDPQNQDARFTYFPVTAGGDGTTVSVADNQVAAQAASLGQVSTAGGQFYVMMSPQDVLQGASRNIAPRTNQFNAKMESPRSTRDDRRRATHNEVERRRRDKINNWIVQLSKLVPDCVAETNKGGQIGNKSKGGILAKSCDYISELRTANVRMAESLKEMERMSVDSDLLRQQCEELKQENAMLRAQLQQHGIVPPDLAPSAT